VVARLFAAWAAEGVHSRRALCKVLRCWPHWPLQRQCMHAVLQHLILLLLRRLAAASPFPPAAAAGRGWQAAEGGLVAVAPPQARAGAGEAGVQHSLQRLAEYVVHLEA
jgi:hypothetical protein